jgi:hypothetical protein
VTALADDGARLRFNEVKHISMTTQAPDHSWALYIAIFSHPFRDWLQPHFVVRLTPRYTRNFIAIYQMHAVTQI